MGLTVNVNRPGFMINPSNCKQMAVGATIEGAGPVTETITRPFTATGCKSLAFAPKLSAGTNAHASKEDGASLNVKITSKGGEEANIKSVKVDLPVKLPSRLSTLQKACTAKQFETNPAGCPEESDVGTATANTPILATPLKGPAYLVSHGGEAFPALEIVLQGEEGDKIVLDGATDIKKGVTSSTFRTVPDAPITSFELNLPTGKYSILTTNLPQGTHYNLCGQTRRTSFARQIRAARCASRRDGSVSLGRAGSKTCVEPQSGHMGWVRCRMRQSERQFIMRIKLRTMFLALMSVLAVSAVAASAALAAAPAEFVAESGSPIGTKITVKSGKDTFTSGNQVITCTSDESVGAKNEITGTTTLGATILLKGCTGKIGSGAACKIHSPEQPNGSIETSPLTGKLGSLPSGKAGIMFKAAEGSIFMAYEPESGTPCLASTDVTNSIIGEVTPVNAFSSTGAIGFTETSEKQTYRHFTPELEAEEVRELKEFGVPMRLVSTENLTFSKNIKVTP